MNAHPNSVGFNISGALRPLWSLLRVPVLGALLLLAPVVESVCGALLLLGLLVSIAFKISDAGASFPFWPMIALSLGFGGFVILYHAVIGMLSR
jgi:hypothetical protein